MRFDLCNVNSLCLGTSWEVVQFKIHSCSRTGARQRNPHTLMPKLALVDTVFASKTEFGLVLEYFCRIEVGLRIILSIEKREKRDWTWKFLSKKAKERKGDGLEIFCPSRKEKDSKLRQVRRGVKSPVP